MYSGNDRLANVWGPAVKAIVPRSEIEQRKAVKRAIGQDGYIRLDALPEYLPSVEKEWSDTGTVTVATNARASYLSRRYQLREIRAYIITPPTGQSLLAEIRDSNNATIGEVEIPAGLNYGATTGLAVDIDSGTWLREATTQIGSGTAGANLTVVAVLYPVED